MESACRIDSLFKDSQDEQGNHKDSTQNLPYRLEWAECPGLESVGWPLKAESIDPVQHRLVADVLESPGFRIFVGSAFHVEPLTVEVRSEDESFLKNLILLNLLIGTILNFEPTLFIQDWHLLTPPLSRYASTCWFFCYSLPSSSDTTTFPKDKLANLYTSFIPCCLAASATFTNTSKLFLPTQGSQFCSVRAVLISSKSSYLATPTGFGRVGVLRELSLMIPSRSFSLVV